jgi:hypothetical protein
MLTTASFDLLRAALADRYRIERELGQGGMATVESAGPEARRLAVVLNWFTDVRARLAKSE